MRRRGRKSSWAVFVLRFVWREKGGGHTCGRNVTAVCQAPDGAPRLHWFVHEDDKSGNVEEEGSVLTDPSTLVTEELPTPSAANPPHPLAYHSNTNSNLNPCGPPHRSSRSSCSRPNAFNQANAVAVSNGASVAKAFITTLNKEFTGLVTKWSNQLAALGTNAVVEKAMTTDDTKPGSVVTTDWLVPVANIICACPRLGPLSTSTDFVLGPILRFREAATNGCISPRVGPPCTCITFPLRSSPPRRPLTRHVHCVARPGGRGARKNSRIYPLKYAVYKMTPQYHALTAAKPTAAVVYANFYTNKKTPKVPTYSCTVYANYLNYFSFMSSAPCPTKNSFWAVLAVPSETTSDGHPFPAGSILDTSSSVAIAGDVFDQTKDTNLADAGKYLLSTYHSYQKVSTISTTFKGPDGEEWFLEVVRVTLGDVFAFGVFV
ncbi:hypothetical protein BDK51DRAFT_26226 [Blyttiomyces helicus]|uniref:Uncharacterized protein n=1 Tax=Blyttiomyces helicus TaxID=388810 RepID=A0A4P9W742_9FUNG|nr:hypothetical protein BDK51DRAFT_26226 [Blyttiomyces helicus]|eukprot:RKO88164.1 hypothetical protein BDK51DRAFT_26226 [Blyttiomyces helicus]